MNTSSTDDRVTATLVEIGPLAHGTIDLPTGSISFGIPDKSGHFRNTPEHLLGSAAASCWLASWGIVAAKLRLEVISSTASATVTVVTEGPTMRISRIVISPVLEIRGDEDSLTSKVQRGCELASRGCIVEKALRAAIESYLVTPSVTFVPA